MDEAESAGRAIEVGSNFFLFFSTKFTFAEAAKNLVPNTMMRDMQHMGSTKQRGSPPDSSRPPPATSLLQTSADRFAKDNGRLRLSARRPLSFEAE
jgi:hypothetical protein